jgi:hypothetical protein
LDYSRSALERSRQQVHDAPPLRHRSILRFRAGGLDSGRSVRASAYGPRWQTPPRCRSSAAPLAARASSAFRSSSRICEKENLVRMEKVTNQNVKSDRSWNDVTYAKVSKYYTSDGFLNPQLYSLGEVPFFDITSGPGREPGLPLVFIATLTHPCLPACAPCIHPTSEHQASAWLSCLAAERMAGCWWEWVYARRPSA